ncbi:MAG: AI-2E family transporter [Leptolyngbya sp. IPPAS B-1204]
MKPFSALILQVFVPYLVPDNFERYIAGQATLAAILASVQTIALFIMGVPLALLFGFTIGAASLVPLAVPSASSP